MKGINLNMKDCKYPNCFECDRPDCDMEKKDIAALLKRRRWEANPEKYRRAQEKYRAKQRANLPHCDKCELCTRVLNDNATDYRRVCTVHMRLVEQKVSNSPHWCVRRKLSGI